MKIFFILLFCRAFIYADDNSDIGFRYGFLSKPSYDSDSISVLSDSSIIYTGDLLKINVGYTRGTDFCGIYKGAQGEYWLFFPKEGEQEQNEGAYSDTLYKPIMGWNEMRQPPGIETFYFINSTNSLSEIISLLRRYENAPPRGKSKLAVRIKEKIDLLDPDVQDDLTIFTSELDEPVVGGIAFRGDDDNTLKDLSVTHECLGIGGIAFKKIVLIHQPPK